MIPAFIVPILNRPELFQQMLDSVDHPVERYVVIDNGNVLKSPSHPERIIRPGHNLGVAASWNLGIKATAQAPWWLVSNFDVTFAPGDLTAIADTMDAVDGPVLLTLAGLGFAVFAVNAAAMEEVGLFDESFHPAYFEDNDFAWRAHLAGVKTILLGHGGTQHVGSATIFGDRSYRDQNHKTFTANRDYYVAKWGGLPGYEVHPRPFGFRLSEPAPSFVRIRNQAWTLTRDVD